MSARLVVLSSILKGFSNAAAASAPDTAQEPSSRWLLKYWPEDRISSSDLRSTIVETVVQSNIVSSDLGESAMFKSAMESISQLYDSSPEDSSLFFSTLGSSALAVSDWELVETASKEAQSLLVDSDLGFSKSFLKEGEFGTLSFMAHDLGAGVVEHPEDVETEQAETHQVVPFEQEPAEPTQPNDVITKVRGWVANTDRLFSYAAILWRGQQDQVRLLEAIAKSAPTAKLMFLDISSAIEQRRTDGLNVQVLEKYLLRMKAAHHIRSFQRALELVPLLGLPKTILAGFECSHTQPSTALVVCDPNAPYTSIDSIISASKRIARTAWQASREWLSGTRSLNAMARKLEEGVRLDVPDYRVIQQLRQYSQDFASDVPTFNRRLAVILAERANYLELQEIFEDLKLLAETVQKLGLVEAALVLNAAA